MICLAMCKRVLEPLSADNAAMQALSSNMALPVLF
jgi:hypothetical protein